MTEHKPIRLDQGGIRYILLFVSLAVLHAIEHWQASFHPLAVVILLTTCVLLCLINVVMLFWYFYTHDGFPNISQFVGMLVGLLEIPVLIAFETMLFSATVGMAMLLILLPLAVHFAGEFKQTREMEQKWTSYSVRIDPK